MRIFLEADGYILGAYWSDDPRVEGWVPVKWPRWTPYINGKCESGLDLVSEVE